MQIYKNAFTKKAALEVLYMLTRHCFGPNCSNYVPRQHSKRAAGHNYRKRGKRGMGELAEGEKGATKKDHRNRRSFSGGPWGT